ncbi:hypothetical protein COU19_00465 [Candidatus Kaiserbacteria bacterium CG10_big_fil_rev_8_21_14_0_10_56_12]|uniref:BioF2-like acetyltransferase domain-containing protein n=1 Tax=Candidatus Kaiserbacteria bacterium CG10_big_fil_rev_8_21_14_0_10_56_12 TaxID=1974611 RepID=A0A2H0UAP9_9BACT|nr:MAG: hypothetical protein COU19_00465 [Candidatus Kaiserbacteria bacterium CG10_big_fil_rev_8_21_14_0_10_56_12]
MHIVPSEQIGDQQWDAFCDTSLDAWVGHRTIGRRSALALDTQNQDHSFAVYDGYALVAVAPLVTRACGDNEYEFALSAGVPVPTPALAPHLSDDSHERIAIDCMAEIDNRARLHHVARSRMAINVFTDLVLDTAHKTNPLERFGYRDDSRLTTVIDLRQRDDQLLRKMSKGHRADIVYSSKQTYVADFFDGQTISQEAWLAFMALYEKAAGRGVLSSARWNEVLERIQQGLGLLAFVRDAAAERYFSGALITIYKKGANYAMAATDPQERSRRGIGQFLQWRIMSELRDRGIEFYDMGGQNGDSEKEVNIARFKRHFGGVPTQVWAGVKEY